MSLRNFLEKDGPSVGFEMQLASAKGGSKEQQAELLDSFREYLKHLAEKTIASEPNGQLSASDLVQSAIIDACNGFEACRAASKDEFKAWLRRILMNDILNRYRFLRRQKRDVSRECDAEVAQLTTPKEDSPDFKAQQKEDEQRLLSAISTLSLDYQQVIRLRHQEKKTFVEIGETMERTPDAVRTLWNQAVEELAKAL